jgi:ABC-type ATPase with predicted acetyltransferase domain
MPTFNIIKESYYNKTFRNESIKGQFDLQIESIKEEFTGNIDIENINWNIGLIVGSSGSGKSTIAKQIFKDEYIKEFKYGNESIIDEMPLNKTTEEITKTFNSVGFATVWSWLKPYNVLSNGEKMRVDLARAILSDKNLIVFDEFTSVVDRTIAKTSSSAIQKAIRKLNKKFVAVACHYDIIDWLEPDWIYDTDKKQFFFVLKNIKDQKLNLKLENVVQKNGNYLNAITI